MCPTVNYQCKQFTVSNERFFCKARDMKCYTLYMKTNKNFMHKFFLNLLLDRLISDRNQKLEIVSSMILLSNENVNSI